MPVTARPARRRWLPVLFAGLLLATALAGCRPAPASLRVTTIASGLHRPWDLAFVPGRHLLITERTGAVKLRVANSGLIRTLADPADVVAVGEGGMMGIAVDPAFSTNRRIYTCFLSDAGGSLDVRLVRWRINETGTALTDRADIVTGIPANPSGRHSGCRPRFGRDGRLWVGTGDAAQPTIPQDPRSLGGKVLRVDTDGNGVAGNAAAPFDARIYSYGHRNVQGIAFMPGTGAPFSIEHGTSRDDEVNRLVAGGNYGWDPRPLSGPLFYDESRPMTDTQRHPGARAAVWSSGSPTIAPSGGTFLSGSQWVGWDRALAMAVLKGQQLRVVGFHATTGAVEQQWVELTGLGRLRVAVQGPDGNLYLATDADPGRILRVTPG
jgi:glucose/arabinose dehydrogenase